MTTGTVYSDWSEGAYPSGTTIKRYVRTYYDWTMTESATDVTIDVSVYIELRGGAAQINAGTITLSATDQTSVTTSKGFTYGSGITLINVINKTYVYPKTEAVQNISITSDYTITKSNWAGTYIATDTFVIPSRVPVIISFNANGGSGNMADISTFTGMPTTLTTNTFSRTGYIFRGWNTSSDGTGAGYLDNGVITVSDNTTLFAQWESKYVAPTISGINAYRVANDSVGYSPDSTLSGTRGYCEIDISGGSDYIVSSVKATFGTSSPVNMTSSDTKYYGYSALNSVPSDSQCNVTVVITLTGTDGVARTYTNGTFISKEVYVIDISANGKSIAFGGSASDDVTGEDQNLYIFNGKVINEDAEIGNLSLGNALPISEGGTGANTLEQAKINLGIGSNDGITITKIWENASPTSTFSAQTLDSSDLDTSGYDMFLVRIKYQNGANAFGMGIAMKGQITKISMLSNDNAYHVSRNYTFAEDGTVTISTGWRSQSTSYTTVAIPVVIWGIKGVQNV